jgi:(S)-2-hydroxyglutarate dehydrogenase
METTDYLIIGGGIVGLSIAREIQQKTAAKVVVIEKNAIGDHASGRNSGVLHAGFYYSPDSLKAKFTRTGNQEMRQFCNDNKLPCQNYGKLVVASNDSELKTLDLLYARGIENGCNIKMVDEKTASEIEPRAKVNSRALYSPDTAVVSNMHILDMLCMLIPTGGCAVKQHTAYMSHKGNVVQTSKGEIEAGKIINAAGLYADKIAHEYGFGLDYSIMPFKGIYWYSNEPADKLKVNVYPVPIGNAFLGVHFTKTVNGDFKIGPTAIPCLWREQYELLFDFKMGEFLEVAKTGLSLLARNKDFRSTAWQEIKKYRKANLVADASRLLKDVDISQFKDQARPGIRAQLVNRNTYELVSDFCVEGDEKSVHILNAVSPAFTCAFPFARYVCDNYIFN